MKECFLYDNWNRLVRAHTATITPTQDCKGDTDTASSSAGSLDPYDTVWAFDDVNRMTSSKDMLASGTPVTAYNHSDTNHPHAISSLSGAATASYVYDANGAMETRAGDSLTYDMQQRLTKYASSETYIYGTSNQRLIRQAGGTRTLYLPGMEVAVTGTTRTITCYLTIGATQIGIKTVSASPTAYTWSCGSMQNSNVCQATVYTTAVTPSIPQRKRYTPYGDSRQTTPVTFPNTDRGFLNQPEDANGLTYLNNRYYDPAIAAFVSVDPLVGKTGQPYLYGAGSPATFSDPSGLDPGWAHDSDPCNDAGYYTCVESKAGPNAGKQTVVGPGERQRAEKARGIGVSPLDPVPSGGCLPEVAGLGPGSDCRDIPRWVSDLETSDIVALYWGYFDISQQGDIQKLDNSISKGDLEFVADPANGYPEVMRRAARDLLDRGLGHSLERKEAGCDAWCWVASAVTVIAVAAVAGGICFLTAVPTAGTACYVSGGVATGVALTVHELAKDDELSAYAGLCKGFVKTVKTIAGVWTGGVLSQLGEQAALAATGC